MTSKTNKNSTLLKETLSTHMLTEPSGNQIYRCERM